jgi:hypothetical protein
MMELAKKYGSMKMLKFHLKHGTVEEFVPSYPKMKNTKLNKFIMKNKITLSKVNSTEILDTIDETISEIEVPEDLPDEFKIKKVKDEDIKELLQEDLTLLSPKKIKSIDSIDLLEEYFRTKNLSKKKEVEKVKPPSLTDIVKGRYKPPVQDTSDDDEIIYYRGKYLTRATVNELSMYDQLSQMGWDGVKLMKRTGMGKNAAKMLKEQKKEKKKKNKKNKDLDEFIVKIMGDNSYDDFGDFEKEMLNFTSENIFN